ncbi:DUF2247 domain-containing protein [Pseudomonas sp. CFBP13528]|uniref:DUF2247 family protein n=1 Tax=Pseudomonas sp. CFBP13528 TaxID=2184006 RepID=UPI0010BF729F|nr:DUF2247 family protein [Pseudomonas sp. CFBP13528]TKK33441.1 DUF2247 domain-containing protein [Pseudomonas sp. CFBP13528]
MSPFNILMDLRLVCWSILLVGFERCWVDRRDIFNFALEQLLVDPKNESVAVLAGGEYLSDEELIDIVSKQVKQFDLVADIDKWRLAFLFCIESSDTSDESKTKALQEVYANFDYPEDMASCSIYSQSTIPPLLAMRQVIEALKQRFLPKTGK